MRKPTQNMEIFRKRRNRLAQQIPGKILIVTSGPEYPHHLFRQDSNLYYLTGFEEPESIFVFSPGRSPESVMFVRKKDPIKETWDGFRFGIEGVLENFGVDKCYLVEDFPQVIPELLKDAEALLYTLYKNPQFDRWIEDALKNAKQLLGRSGACYLPVEDAAAVLGEMRVIKTAEEIDIMRRACEISGQAHIETMKATRPGVNERQLQGHLYFHFLQQGASREAYNFIVASGNNATTLHYNFNDQVCKDGDLLLVDAGAEYLFYKGDITRTFPVNGRFTDEQALVYEAVLRVQKHILSMIRPGLLFQKMQETAVELLTEEMLELGLFQGTKESLISSLEYKKYYPHGLGHYLGMDVHDVGYYLVNKQPRPIEENMIFTVEPGLYLPLQDPQVPEKFRGIGVRIEDDIRVTLNGYENLTSFVPKEISDLEKIVGKSSAF